MPPPFAFVAYGASHLLALAVIAALTALAIAAARRDPGARWLRAWCVALALLQVLNQLAWHLGKALDGRWELRDSLPFQLCDAAVLTAVIALFRHSPLAFELTYFWGLAATFQGLVTPDLNGGPETFRFWSFFVTHGGIVHAALLLSAGVRLTPRRRAVLRVWLWTNAVFLLAAAANLLTGGNYMYLARAPESGSLLDWLGPWPWYILSGELLALALYHLLALPLRNRPPGAGFSRPPLPTPASSPSAAGREWSRPQHRTRNQVFRQDRKEEG